MDALYFYKHSRHDDIEIKYSLRGIEQNLPWIRKVWILGDRPHFLTADTDLIEHVPHEYIARVQDFRTPVTNFFLLFYLSAILPRLDHEFLWFCDDFIVLEPLSEEDAKQARVVEDLDGKQRGKGLWKESLWRTYDLLKRIGYPGWNFETHVPTYFTKTRVIEAYCEFRDFVTQDRWFGMLGPTAILNHALTREVMPLLSLAHEGRKVGFYGSPSPYEVIADQCRGKAFLNFDDDAYSVAMLRFLDEQLSLPSRYEETESVLGEFEEREWSAAGIAPPQWPAWAGQRVAVFMRPSRQLPFLLNQLAILPCSCIVLCPGVEQSLVNYYAGSNIRVVHDAPMDLSLLAAQCDLAISHGASQFTEVMSLAGKPQLLLPVKQGERESSAAIASRGIGVTAELWSARQIVAGLRQVWEKARPL